MNDTAERLASFWSESAPLVPRAPLREDLTAETVIVGAGIAGLTTAYLLARAGQNVVVIDDRQPAAGMTGRTTAHLSFAIDDRYFEIERVHGAEGARLAADSHRAAVERIERICREEKIDCDFMRLDGYLLLGEGTPDRVLGREYEAAHHAGLTEVERLPGLDIAGLNDTPALRFPGQGQFHPLRYLHGLLLILDKLGVRIYGETRVVSVEGGGPARVRTASGHTVEAAAAVVATNTPVNDLAVIHTKQAPYTTYVIAGPVPAGSVPRGLYWDTLDPYHYVRLQRLPDDPAYELLIVGGEDHKTGQSRNHADSHARLEEWARTRFPQLGPVRYRWSGQVMETIDGLAFIGRNPLDRGNVYIATGDSGMGITHGTIAGMLLSDLIAGRDNPWAALYDPARKPAAAIRSFAQENLNVARQYLKWAMPASLRSLDELPNDCGVVAQHGAAKHALYRAADGSLHARSAVCTHLGCVVAWNDVEKIWECPCHGSRYDAYGKVLTGPAKADLAPVEEAAAE